MGDWAYEAHAAPCPGGPPWEWPTRSGGPEKRYVCLEWGMREEQCSGCVSAWAPNGLSRVVVAFSSRLSVSGSDVKSARSRPATSRGRTASVRAGTRADPQTPRSSPRRASRLVVRARDRHGFDDLRRQPKSRSTAAIGSETFRVNGLPYTSCTTTRSSCVSATCGLRPRARGCARRAGRQVCGGDGRSRERARRRPFPWRCVHRTCTSSHCSSTASIVVGDLLDHLLIVVDRGRSPLDAGLEELQQEQFWINGTSVLGPRSSSRRYGRGLRFRLPSGRSSS